MEISSETEADILDLVNRYERNPLLKALVKLIPLGSAIEAGLLTRITNIRLARTKVFFDELEKDTIELKPELIESNDFLHCFFITFSSAIKNRRKEKIQLFARLLKSSTSPNCFSDIEDFEDYLKILDELTYREILILKLLDGYESKFPKGVGENQLQRAKSFWPQFENDLENSIRISNNEIKSVMTRLNRTGCYETIVGAYYGYTGGYGYLTQTYYRLKKIVEL